jgi:SAM-dependent methyltransferase
MATTRDTQREGGDVMTAWHEEDAFWEIYGSAIFTEDRWRAAPNEVEAILALLDLPQARAVLDLGFGVGRHTLELARRGFHVTGVDRTASYLAEAQERGEREGQPAEFVVSDMRDFTCPGAFDAALSLWTSFGYFEAPEANVRVLKNVAGSLKPGGQLLLQLAGKEVLARIFQARDWHEQDGAFFLQERSVDRNWSWSWMDTRRVLIREGQVHDRHLGHWIYSAKELVDMLRGSGFANVDVYGNLDGGPYDRTARELVAVARTPV